MNVEARPRGFSGLLAALNADGPYGMAMMMALALLLIPELGGEPARQAMSFDREALRQGEAWRALSAHFVHLDLRHALANALGLLVSWTLFARDYAPWRWATIYLGAAVAVSAGIWFFSPEVEWYVGASGALHGVLAAGTLAHWRRGRHRDALFLTVLIVAKIAYEQRVGALPFAGAADTIVDAHLYGALGGLLLGWILGRSRA
jgi:rhomboid family GlyGly-CTERM serine protease